MSILLNDNLNISAAKPVDSRYGPYNNTADALAAIPPFQRYRGLVIGVIDTVLREYWFKDGILDTDLVEKISEGNGGTGFTGSAGLDGFTGSQGDIGYTGSLGYTGSQGDIGYTGSAGLDGYDGSVGYTGSQGYTGSEGYTGSLGYTGSAGDIGYTGSQGDIGYTGSQGDIGYTGSQGEGYTGSAGTDGYTGSQGDIGYTGSVGDVGYTGSTGFTGSSGDVGFTGSAGVDGVIGQDGYTGSQGDIGYTGSAVEGLVSDGVSSITIQSGYTLIFPDGSGQISSAPRMYTNADAENGLSLSDLKPGDYYYDDVNAAIYICYDTGLGYFDILDLTVRA